MGAALATTPQGIDIWVWPLSTNEMDASDLSKEEVARAERFADRSDQYRFVAARLGVRQLLARYLHCTAAEVCFEAEARSKPRLDVRHGSTLQFNLSHSHGLAALAVADGLELGIDIESVRAAPGEVAARYFSERERADLAACAPARASRAFFQLWTGKEAFVKAIGEGLYLPLHTFDVTIGDEETSLINVHDQKKSGCWRLWRFEPGPGFVGAVVARADESWTIIRRD